MLALGFRVVQSEWQDPVTVGSGTGLSGSKRFRTSGNLQPTSDAVFQSPRGLFESALDPQQLLSSTPDGAPYRTPTPARKDEEPACNTDGPGVTPVSALSRRIEASSLPHPAQD
jgi:hypothetical protein